MRCLGHSKCCNNILPCRCVRLDINIWFLAIIFELIFCYYAISSSILRLRICSFSLPLPLSLLAPLNATNAITISTSSARSFAIWMFRLYLCFLHHFRLLQSQRINFDFHVHVNEFEWNVNRTDIIINNHVCIDYYSQQNRHCDKLDAMM